MSSRMVRVIALIWTAAALFQAMSLALRLGDGDWSWGFWLSILLLLVWVSGAAAYWMLPRTQFAHSAVLSAADPARPRRKRLPLRVALGRVSPRWQRRRRTGQ